MRKAKSSSGSRSLPLPFRSVQSSAHSQSPHPTSPAVQPISFSSTSCRHDSFPVIIFYSSNHHSLPFAACFSLSFCFILFSQLSLFFWRVAGLVCAPCFLLRMCEDRFCFTLLEIEKFFVESLYARVLLRCQQEGFEIRKLVIWHVCVLLWMKWFVGWVGYSGFETYCSITVGLAESSSAAFLVFEVRIEDWIVSNLAFLTVLLVVLFLSTLAWLNFQNNEDEHMQRTNNDIDHRCVYLTCYSHNLEWRWQGFFSFFSSVDA